MPDILSALRLKLNHLIKTNEPLAPYTTFKIGGPAEYFVSAESVEYIQKAVQTARELEIPYFILGGGSNVLIADKGVKGLVIWAHNNDYKFIDENGAVLLQAGAGAVLSHLVMESARRGLAGLEWAAGIPGTIGGAICGNAGCFGCEIADVVKKVTVLRPNGMEVDFTGQECDFSYRCSIFKKELSVGYAGAPAIILSAELRLKKSSEEEARDKVREYAQKRQEQQPLDHPSAGSIFQNIPLTPQDQELKKKAREWGAPQECLNQNFIPVGWLIEELGLKGKRIGDAQVSEKHANFIVNRGKATAEDVVILISLIKQKVRVKFGVQLKEEIIYVGF